MQRPWAPEFVIDEGLAREVIRSQFGDIAAAKLELLGVGWDNTAYLVDDAYVFRFPRREIAVPLLERESAALPLIADAVEVLIPEPKWLGKPTHKFGWPFSGYPFISGRSAIGLPPDGRRKLVRPLAEFLRQLHDIDRGKAKAAGVSQDTLGKLSWAKWIPRLREFVAEFETRGHELKYDRLRSFLDLLEYRKPVDSALNVVHGDFYFRHALVDENGELTGIIDWGDISLNSPAVDLSIAFTLFPAELREEFFAAYGRRLDDDVSLLAKMRAFVYGCVLLNYGLDSSDRAIVDESLWILNQVEDFV